MIRDVTRLLGLALIAGMLCIIPAPSAVAQSLKLQPVDEAAKNPAFAK